MYNRSVIIVTGSIHCHPDHLTAVLDESLAHVRRSRLEPGCLLHSVHVDAENPNRLVFVEHWEDRAALLAHFQVPASRAFARAAAAHAVEPTVIDIFEATPVTFPG